MTKQWLVQDDISQDILDQFKNFTPKVLQLLYNRGLTEKSDIQQFLYPDYEKDLHDPFLFTDMQKAVERMIKALQNKERILIYGDYDADGVSSSAVAFTTLEALQGDIDVYIPHRVHDGYGLNKAAVQNIIDEKYDLVITVDCGISNVDEVKMLQDAGIDVIVTDHHEQPPVLPKPYALINPNMDSENYPFRYLAGVGVAYKTMSALLQTLEEKQLYFDKEIIESYGGYAGLQKWLLDLVSIGTVADCMPLINENRTLVKYGLKVMQKTRRAGLRSLCNVARLDVDKLDSYSIGFKIGPRINSAGRIDNARVAFDILISQDHDHAHELCQNLDKTNTKRQSITEGILRHIKKEFTSEDDTHMYFAFNEEWPSGVVGLAAGRLSDRFYRPAIVMTRVKGKIVGSGRSIPQFNLIKAMQEIPHYFEKYGGHSQACGFTIADEKTLELFQNDLYQLCKDEIHGKDLTPILSIDTQIELKEITWDLVQSLILFEPFGAGNPSPLFLIKNVIVVDFSILGKRANHLRLVVSDDSGTTMKAIAFGFAKEWGDTLRFGDRVDIVASLGVNEWNGRRDIQIKVEDMRKGNA